MNIQQLPRLAQYCAKYHGAGRFTVDTLTMVTHTLDMNNMSLAQEVARITDSRPPSVNHFNLHVVCAWCSSVLHAGDTTQPTSHGICDACSSVALEGVK